VKLAALDSDAWIDDDPLTPMLRSRCSEGSLVSLQKHPEKSNPGKKPKADRGWVA
jgi:hypothetical protein